MPVQGAAGTLYGLYTLTKYYHRLFTMRIMTFSLDNLVLRQVSALLAFFDSLL